MKHNIWLAVFLIALIGETNAFADIEKIEEITLPKQKLGRVVYTVLPALREIHIELPFQLNLNFIRVNGAFRSEKVYLQGFAELNFRASEIQELKKQYEGYKIIEEGGSLQITSCELVISDKKKIECGRPPVGNYFSVEGQITADEAAQLKKKLLSSDASPLRVEVEYAEPVVKRWQLQNVKLADLCTGAQSETLGGAVVRLGHWLKSNYKYNLTAGVQNLALDELLQNCLSVPANSPNHQLKTAADLYDISVQSQSVENKTVALYEMQRKWRSAQREALVEIKIGEE